MKITGCLLGLFSFTALANYSQADLTELSFDELMEIEVTSVSKKSQKLSQAAAAIYVVTNEDIQRSGATTIPEALRLIPGVDASQIDGNRWSVGIRGFSGRFAGKLLVMVDGRTVYTPTFSGVYWEQLDYLMTDIERIEVIRGPGATLWGTNAVNGVINIITKEAAETQGHYVQVAAGNELKSMTGFRSGGKLSNGSQYRAYAKSRHIDGTVDPQKNHQHNGGQHLKAGFRLDWQQSHNQAFSFQGDLFKNELEQQHYIPSATWPEGSVQAIEGDNTTKGGFLSSEWSRIIGLNSEFSANLRYDYYDRNDYKYGDKRHTIDLDWQHTFTLASHHELIWGGGYRWSDNKLTSGTLAEVKQRELDTNIWNLFVQNQWASPEHTINVTLGAKLEGNSHASTELQPNLRLAWTPSNHWTLWGAISRATRTPSRGETDNVTMYTTTPVSQPSDSPPPYPVLGSFSGSDEFGTEKVDAYELGLRWMPTHDLSLDIATYFNKYKELRDYQLGEPYLSRMLGFPAVIAPAKIISNLDGEGKGVELFANWQAGPTSRFQLSYTYTTLDLKQSDTNPLSLLLVSMEEERTPEHTLALSNRIDINETVNLDVRLFYMTDRSWSFGQVNGIDDRYNADLRISWQSTPELLLSLVGRNLLHSSEPEFIVELWPADTYIERNVFIKAEYCW